jgi:hypothetical protein
MAARLYDAGPSELTAIRKLARSNLGGRHSAGRRFKFLRGSLQ